MNSFNHYAFGAVGEWLFSGAAGVHLDESHPGYKRFFLRPQFTRRLTHVKATQESPYGLISSHWYVAGDRIVYDVVVPPNSSAVLELPVPAEGTATPVALAAGRHRFSIPKAAIADDPAGSGARNEAATARPADPRDS